MLYQQKRQKEPGVPRALCQAVQVKSLFPGSKDKTPPFAALLSIEESPPNYVLSIAGQHSATVLKTDWVLRGSSGHVSIVPDFAFEDMYEEAK